MPLSDRARMTPRLDRAARRLIEAYRKALKEAGVPLDAVVAGYRTVARSLEIHVVTVLDADGDRVDPALKARAFELEAEYSRQAEEYGLPIRFLTYSREPDGAIEGAQPGALLEQEAGQTARVE